MEATTNQLKFSEFVDLILARIYDMEKKYGTGHYFNLNSIAGEIIAQVPREWVFDAAKVLESRGLIQCVYAIGGMCRALLTGHGRIFVELEEGSGIIKKYNEKPEYYIHVQGDNVQLAFSGNESPVTQTLTIDTERKQLFELLEEIKGLINNDEKLIEAEKEDAVADVAVIEKQLKKREPNFNAIAALLEPLGRIVSIADKIAYLIRLLNC